MSVLIGRHIPIDFLNFLFDRPVLEFNDLSPVVTDVRNIKRVERLALPDKILEKRGVFSVEDAEVAYNCPSPLMFGQNLISQPDLQYIVNPSTDPTVRNALGWCAFRD